MNKKIITLTSIITGLIIIIGGYFLFLNNGNTIKSEHSKYLSLINDNHDFDAGLKGLESLDNDKGVEVLKNIKTEIKIAKELKNTDSSLDNKDIDSAKKSLDKADLLTIDSSFDKAIEWLREDITNYEKVLKEINDTKEDISTILEKYKFNHNALKAKLSDEKTPSNKESSNSSTSSIPDTEYIPRVGAQQSPITYGELKRGYYNDGTSETIINNLLSQELGAPVANFSNEQIRDAIVLYNQKNSNRQTPSNDPLEIYYARWAAEIKKTNPDANIIKDTDGKYYVEGIVKNRVAVVYENPNLIRLVNATTNIHVDF